MLLGIGDGRFPKLPRPLDEQSKFVYDCREDAAGMVQPSSAKMRNVIFAINITLDGCCDHTKMIADEEMHEYFTHLMRDVDLLVFGRKPIN